MQANAYRFQFRVRYGETDQMGTVYNARVLDWFEVGRTELSRALGLPYAEWERRGIYLPLIEAHVRYRARARYDDLLEMTVGLERVGGVRLRFNNEIRHAGAGGDEVASGYTIHALVNGEGRPTRAPAWLETLLRDPRIAQGDSRARSGEEGEEDEA